MRSAFKATSHAFAGVLAAAGVLLSSGFAQAASSHLDAARAHYRSQRFTEAARELDLALQAPGTDTADKIAIFELSARCAIAEGERTRAEAAYASLLALDPTWQPDPSLSPKILDAFERTKTRLFPNDYVRLEPVSSAPGRFEVRVVDPWNRVGSVILLAAEGSAPLQQASPGPTHTAAFDLSGAPRTALVQARDGAGRVLARLTPPAALFPELFPAAPAQPQPAPALDAPGHSAPAPAPPVPPPSRMAAWSLGAAAVAALIAGTVLQAASRGSANDARSKDWADEAQARQATAVSQAQWSRVMFVGAGVLGAGSGVLFAW